MGYGEIKFCQVSITFEIHEVFEVSSADQTVELGLYLSMSWKEPRIEAKRNHTASVILDTALVNKHMWKPGLVDHHQ